jgi:hypothetical protein
MKKAALMVSCLCSCWGALAQSQEYPPAAIRQEREILAQERERIIQLHDQMARDCWQKFAVNDCLAAVRKSKRAELDPLHQKELALNTQEREWRTRQRLDRLQNKASDDGVRLDR